MAQIPSWVPDEVVDTLAHLEQGDDAREVSKIRDSSRDSFWDTQLSVREMAYFLRRAMTSDSMEKTWRAIARRSENVDPSRYAMLVIKMFIFRHQLLRGRDAATVTAWQNLAKDALNLRKNHSELNEGLFGKSMDGPGFFDDAVGEIQGIAEYLTSAREELSDIAGKAGAPSAARTYLIRVLASDMMRLYGTPLYSVVAETVAFILDEEPLDDNHVMKLVKSNRQFTYPAP